jgi:hypothetical protein
MSRYAHEAFLAGILLSLPLAAVSAYAQQAVSGTYINEGLGVEITFPDGWSGFEVSQTSETTLVATSPGGLSESDPATMKTINLLITDKSGRDSRDPSSLTQDVIDCNPPSVNSRTVAGAQASEVTVDCPSSAQKMRMVAVETEDKIVAVMFMTPASEFDSNVGAFESAVTSLKVEGAEDTESTGGTPGGNGGGGVSIELTTDTRTVVIAGANVNVDFRTNSTISALTVDEDKKQVSFTVDGQTGTSGTTEVEIGQMLMGPYTVTIDGQTTTDFEVANEGSVDAVMTLSYTHSEHDVVITGTSVVPEFPVVLVGALSAIVGVVAIVGRTRFLIK